MDDNEVLYYMGGKVVGRLKFEYGDEIYELVWLLRRKINCQLVVETILRMNIPVFRRPLLWRPIEGGMLGIMWAN